MQPPEVGPTSTTANCTLKTWALPERPGHPCLRRSCAQVVVSADSLARGSTRLADFTFANQLLLGVSQRTRGVGKIDSPASGSVGAQLFLTSSTRCILKSVDFATNNRRAANFVRHQATA